MLWNLSSEIVTTAGCSMPLFGVCERPVGSPGLSATRPISVVHLGKTIQSYTDELIRRRGFWDLILVDTLCSASGQLFEGIELQGERAQARRHITHACVYVRMETDSAVMHRIRSRLPRERMILTTSPFSRQRLHRGRPRSHLILRRLPRGKWLFDGRSGRASYLQLRQVVINRSVLLGGMEHWLDLQKMPCARLGNAATEAFIGNTLHDLHFGFSC